MKLRHIICAVIMVACITSTPWAIVYSYLVRGYSAIGGEYMIIPFGIMLCGIIITIADGIEFISERSFGNG